MNDKRLWNSWDTPWNLSSVLIDTVILSLVGERNSHDLIDSQREREILQKSFRIHLKEKDNSWELLWTLSDNIRRKTQKGFGVQLEIPMAFW